MDINRRLWQQKQNEAIRAEADALLKAENIRLRAALTTVQVMARNGADLGDADEWTSLFLTEIAAYAESALRSD